MAETEIPSFTVLRIKRKATEPPLSSLVIQDPAADRFTSRIKKRRDVSGRPKGVFRLAETVPETWEGKGSEGELLKSRIKDLLAIAGSPSPSQMSSPAASQPSLKAGTSSAVTSINSPSSDPAPDPADSAHAPDSTVSVPAPVPDNPQMGPLATQYRVVPPPRAQRSMMPPQVLSAREVESGSLVFVDAQAVSEAGPSRRKSSSGATKALKDAEAAAVDDAEMASFLPMLQEYLKLSASSESAAKGGGSSALVSTSSAEEQYVYDLYYRDLRPSSFTNIQMGVGDGVTPMTMMVGALIGYEDFSPPSSPSESEAEDEADEDSNDEDFYRNDYPEDEDADEDMQGPGLADDWSDSDEDGDDRSGSGSEAGSDEGRGNWDYR